MSSNNYRFKSINLNSDAIINNSTVAGLSVTDALNNLATSSIGGDWYFDAIWIDGSTTVSVANQDGKMGTPFATFAQAISAAEAKQNSLPIGPLPTERCGTRQVFIVAGGIYDEDINMLRGNTFYEFLALGYVTLGNGLGPDFASTNTRHVTWVNTQFQENVDVGVGVIRRPQLILGTLVDMGETSSTHTAAAIGWDISGNIILTNPDGPGASTTAEFHLKNVRVRGTIDSSTDFGLRNCYIYKGRVGGQVIGSTGGTLFFQVVEYTRFELLVSIHTVCMITNCNFDAGMTVLFNGSDVPPSGFENTRFAGTYTRAGGGTANLICDLSTLDFFIENGATLAGGATIQFRNRGFKFPIIAAAPVDVPPSGAGTARFDTVTNTLYVYNGIGWIGII